MLSFYTPHRCYSQSLQRSGEGRETQNSWRNTGQNSSKFVVNHKSTDPRLPKNPNYKRHEENDPQVHHSPTVKNHWENIKEENLHAKKQREESRWHDSILHTILENANQRTVTESSSVVASGSQDWGSVGNRRDGSQKGKRKPLGITSLFIILTVVMVSQCVYMSKTYQTIHLK